MRVRGSRSSREPRDGAWSADGREMASASPSEGGVLEEGGHSVGLDLRRQRLLGGGVRFSIDTGASGDHCAEYRLSDTEAATFVNVEGIERRPDDTAKVAAGGETCDVGSGSVLAGRTGADSTGGDAQESQAPVVIREGRADEATEGEADVGVCSKEARGLSIWRNSAKRVQNLSPPGARPKETKVPMGSQEPADSIDESPSLTDPPPKKKLTPLERTNGGPKQLEASSTIPAAPRETVRPEGCRAG